MTSVAWLRKQWLEMTSWTEKCESVFLLFPAKCESCTTTGCRDSVSHFQDPVFKHWTTATSQGNVMWQTHYMACTLSSHLLLEWWRLHLAVYMWGTVPTMRILEGGYTWQWVSSLTCFEGSGWIVQNAPIHQIPHHSFPSPKVCVSMYVSVHLCLLKVYTAYDHRDHVKCLSFVVSLAVGYILGLKCHDGCVVSSVCPTLAGLGYAISWCFSLPLHALWVYSFFLSQWTCSSLKGGVEYAMRQLPALISCPDLCPPLTLCIGIWVTSA